MFRNIDSLSRKEILLRMLVSKIPLSIALMILGGLLGICIAVICSVFGDVPFDWEWGQSAAFVGFAIGLITPR
jgi:hypothetical protein